MLGKIEKILLYVSSYLPLYFLLLYKEWEKLNLNELKDILRLNSTKLYFLITMSLLILASIIITVKFLFTPSNKTLEIKKNLQSSGDNIISYIMSYLVPMLSLDVNDRTILIVNFVLFFIIGILYVRNDLIYLNPVLSLLGYKFYICADDNSIVLTKFSLGQLESMIENGNNVFGNKLAKNLFLYKTKKESNASND